MTRTTSSLRSFDLPLFSQPYSQVSDLFVFSFIILQSQPFRSSLTPAYIKMDQWNFFQQTQPWFNILSLSQTWVRLSVVFFIFLCNYFQIFILGYNIHSCQHQLELCGSTSSWNFPPVSHLVAPPQLYFCTLSADTRVALSQIYCDLVWLPMKMDRSYEPLWSSWILCSDKALVP